LIFYQSLDSGILYFSLLDLESNDTTWSQEVYVNFEYFRCGGLFHSFEGDSGVYGILFVSSKDSEEFFDVVTEQLKKTVGTGNQASKPGRKAKSIFRAFLFKRKSETACAEADLVEKNDDDKSLIGEKSLKSRKKENNELTHDDVSEPRDFRHLSHIGFNPDKGTFDVSNDMHACCTQYLDSKHSLRMATGLLQGRNHGSAAGESRDCRIYCWIR